MLAAAQNVQAVLAGRSLSDTLAATDASLRASVQAVSFHTMRRLGTATALREILVPRKPPNALLDALLKVALALLDTAVQAAEPGVAASLGREVPVYAPHTVVDQAVRAAGRHKKLQPFKGLVNGVLRRFLRERPHILAQAMENPEAQHNHPLWWVERLQQAYPLQWQSLLEAANRPGPMALRVNARKARVDHVLDAFKQAGIEAWSPQPDAIVLTEPRPVHALPGFDEGWWSVQDLSAQQAGRLLPVANGMRVLDACAAPGGKTAHLLERADLELTALDSDPERLKRVEQNLNRLGLYHDGVQLKCADAANLEAWWDGRPFDAILADVPCTASGVVRRHPDIRWLRRKEDVARTAALQKQIVDALWQTLKPGGHLLYATCSIFPEEGEKQAQAFAKRHADATRLPAPGQILPLSGQTDAAGTKNGVSAGLSHSHDINDDMANQALGDGFFYALFAKNA
ncbi:MAG TPA: 16S rRNA (cytosine(967)-C(5))-methyltransferase RsmB [Burkholderiaceae bacterium]|nr:16S rRNA (cytosine(967)-C(5))-methyltransferase RsmB [Burkholderiaceae bacterium]